MMVYQGKSKETVINQGIYKKASLVDALFAVLEIVGSLFEIHETVNITNENTGTSLCQNLLDDVREAVQQISKIPEVVKDAILCEK